MGRIDSQWEELCKFFGTQHCLVPTDEVSHRVRQFFQSLLLQLTKTDIAFSSCELREDQTTK